MINNISGKDLFYLIIKSCILTILLILLSGLFFYLIQLNINFANYVSDVNNIPRDLKLTVSSLGFANNIVFLSTIFEFEIIIWLIDKILQISFFKIIDK